MERAPCFGRRLKDLALGLVAAYYKQEILRCAQDDKWNKNRLLPGSCFSEKNAYFREPRATPLGFWYLSSISPGLHFARSSLHFALG